MKVLVTGGGGFIGSHVVDTLRRHEHEVMVFDHAGPGIYAEFGEKGIERFMGDVRDSTAVTEAVAHVDAVIHLAAVLGTQETIQNPRPSAETNILGSLNVFEAAEQYGVPVVYAGVGNHWMRLHGAGSYTISKTAVEDYARMFNQFRQHSNISVVRPVNAYGPRQSIAAPYGTSKVRKIMPSFTCRALVGDPIELYGGGEQVSDCVFVTDVAEVFVRTLEEAKKNGAPLKEIEVGPSGSVTVRQTAEIVRRVASSLTGAESEITSLPMRPGEVPGAVVAADVSGLEQLGIKPGRDFVSLEAGINATVNWYYDNWFETYALEKGLAL